MARGSRTWAERFVVPALAGPGLTVSELLTVKFGAAKAGTTNGAGISAHGIWDLWHEVRGLGPRFVVPALAGPGLTVSQSVLIRAIRVCCLPARSIRVCDQDAEFRSPVTASN